MSRDNTRLFLFIVVLASSCVGHGSQTVSLYFDHPMREGSALSRGDSTAIPFREFAVARVVSSDEPEKEALLLLLQGPTNAEADSGYASNLEGLRFSLFSIAKGTAVVKLEGRLILKGTLSGPRLRKQVEQTLMQFPRVKAVKLYINGREDFDSLK